MSRALPAFGLGLILALLLDQVIRLLPAPTPNEDGHWYLQTVQYHPLLGWSGYPNFVGTKDGIPIQTNSRGYRDREPVDVEDGHKPGVLFLGDSFTWGDEVRLEERFTSLLEASCGLVCDRLPALRAMNKGIIGYGTAQSLLDYTLGRDERPFDVVILALYTGNDLTDNAEVDSPSGPRPRLIRCERKIAGQGLCLEGVPVAPVVDWPEHRLINPRGRVAGAVGWSGLITFASQRRAPGVVIKNRIASQMGDVLSALKFPIVERTSEAPVTDRIGQMEAILRALTLTTHAGGRAFGVMVFPSARMHAGDAGELQDYREILGVLGRLDIPFVDYYEKTKGLRWQDLYSGIQGHWRASGHQEAATLLRSLLVTLSAGTP